MPRPFFRPAHRDASEPAIIAALRAVGASVWPISGEDVPDLLVGYKGRTVLLEVKTRGIEYTDKRNGKTYKRDGKLSKGQQAFQDAWKGGPCRVVHTPEEALYAVGAPVEGVLAPLPRNSATATTQDVAAAINADPSSPLVATVEGLVITARQPPPQGPTLTAANPSPRRTGNVTPTHLPKKRK